MNQSIILSNNNDTMLFQVPRLIIDIKFLKLKGIIEEII